MILIRYTCFATSQHLEVYYPISRNTLSISLQEYFHKVKYNRPESIPHAFIIEQLSNSLYSDVRPMLCLDMILRINSVAAEQGG